MTPVLFRLGRSHCIMAIAMLLLTGSGSVAAQYIWLGPNGVKQYSDTPPPASVPAANILKQPGRNAGSNAVTSAPAAGEPPAPSTPAVAPAPPSLAQRNADYAKRRAEQEDKDRKAADEQKLASERARNCERAKTYQRTLDSGERIAQVGKDGERAYMNDTQRAQESAEAKRMLAECAKG
ncbi:MAG: DUF4124 domain-containing protein [Janthinobacterium lividum]